MSARPADVGIRVASVEPRGVTWMKLEQAVADWPSGQGPFTTPAG
jgi:hypothetical protein